MSELRDRIAAVITDGKIAGDGHGTIADAVIAELGLRIEIGERSNPTGIAWAANNRHKVQRYVTEWKRESE